MLKGFIGVFNRNRAVFGFIGITAIALLIAVIHYAGSAKPVQRPVLGLMTTLPLQWSEGGIEADLSADAKPHPAFARLRDRYQIKPLDTLNRLAVHTMPMLLLAQPRALAPAELVRLDRWVRNGGRLLILADPALQWGSLYPLGDKRRPLFTSLLSPLFAHWGLELVLPMTDEPGMALRDVGDVTIRTQTPGEWVASPGKSAGLCKIASHRLLADCAIGKGRALLVADADLLDTPYWQGRGVRIVTGDDEFGNILWMESLLADLGRTAGNSREFVE